jgi:hypothetical protein
MNARLVAVGGALQSWLTQSFTMPGDAAFLAMDLGDTGVNSGAPGTGSGASVVLHNKTTSADIDLMLPSAAMPGQIGSHYRLYVTDVSAFKGAEVELKFSIWVAPLQTKSFWADNIRFMNAQEAAAALPEPATMALISLGALALLRRRRSPSGRE